jgi:hypothetical protein
MENLQVIPNIPNFGTSEELPKEFSVEIPSSAMHIYGFKHIGDFTQELLMEAEQRGYRTSIYFDPLTMCYVIKGKRSESAMAPNSII